MNHIKLKGAQAGVATMLISIVMLVAISLISIYSAQVGVMDQKISGNYYRTTQAFEAAQAGMENILAKINMDVISSALCTGSGNENTSGDICQFQKRATGTGSISSFSDEDVTLDALATNGQQNIGEFTVSFEKNVDYVNMVTVTLSGYAGDNPSANNDPNINITQNMIKTPLIYYRPPVPLISKGDVELDVNANIDNNSSNIKAAFWSGGPGVLAQYDDDTNTWGTPADITGTTGYYANAASLSALDNESFFENFFSESKEAMKKRAQENNAVLNCNVDGVDCTAAQLMAIVASSDSDIIWFNGFVGWDADDSEFEYNDLEIDPGSNITFGSATNPKILIVDGEFELKDLGSSFFGLIYVMGEFDAEGGNITGAVITEEEAEVENGAGSAFNLTYSDDVFDRLDAKFARFTRVAGSWKDF